MGKRAILIIAVLSSAAPALAQHQFDSWTTENGLPQNSVLDILQTRDGYLWLATYGGLVRFDGVRFIVFDRSTPGIGSQRIMALREDSAGTLWAATADGRLIQHQGGRFTTYVVPGRLPDLIAVRIDEDADRHLWITWTGAVTRFDGERFVHYRPDNLPHGVRPPSLFLHDETWWSHDARGVHVFIDASVKTYPLDAHTLRAGVTGLNVDRYGNVWIRTNGAGVVKAANGRLERYTVEEGLPTNAPDGLFRHDRHGGIWFSDAAQRVYRIKDGTRELMNESGLLALYEDGEGSTWLGTNIGLYRIRDHAIALYSKRDGLSHDWVYSILQDRRGAMWIGTWGGGVNRYERGRFRRYGRRDGLRSDAIMCLYEDRMGRLWVGTQLTGIARLDNGRFTYEASELLTENVWTVHQDRSGTFWFGTDRGLVRKAGEAVRRYTAKDGLSHDQVTTLFEDRSGALWIGGFQGVARLKDGLFTRYTEREGLVGNEVRAFHEDTDGVLWIGTYDGGLYRLAGGRLTRYTRASGFPDNGVFQILEDDDGYLWMGSNRGIYRVSRRELNDFSQAKVRSVSARLFGAAEGLSSVEVNGGRSPSGWKTPDGKLWFPTMGGVAAVDPSQLRTNPRAPSLIIEEVRVAGTPIDFSGGVTIGPDTPMFEIRYTAPSFIKPEQVRFRYRLAGLESAWVEAGDRRTATYHRIPPGEYRFVVAAANADGVWNAPGQGLAIAVLPPFWRTWWFILLLAIAGASSVALGHEWRIRRLRDQNAVREAFLGELIRSQETERRRIASEMHDSLGQELAIIRSRVRTALEAPNDSGHAREALGAIAAAAERLAPAMKEIAHALRPYQIDRLGLSKALESLARTAASACQIEMTTAIANVDAFFPHDSQIHVFRIVQEALNNIVEHSRAHRAALTVARQGGVVEIQVTDDGAGFAVEQSGHETSGSFGLTGLRERVRMLGGDVDIRSSQGQGTTITARFPFRSAADA